MNEPMWGISDSADFDKYTWTFRMQGDYRVAAGAYAIIPDKEYQALAAAPPSEPAERRVAQRRLIRSDECDCGRRWELTDRRQNNAAYDEATIKATEHAAPAKPYADMSADEFAQAAGIAPNSTLPLSAEGIQQWINGRGRSHPNAQFAYPAAILDNVGIQALRAIELEQQVAEKDREIARLANLLHDNQAGSNVLGKQLAKAEAELAELRRVKS